MFYLEYNKFVKTLYHEQYEVQIIQNYRSRFQIDFLYIDTLTTHFIY